MIQTEKVKTNFLDFENEKNIRRVKRTLPKIGEVSEFYLEKFLK